MIVVDASALITSLVRRDPAGRRMRRRLREDLDNLAPQLIKAEVLSGLRRMAAAGEVTAPMADAVARQLMMMRIETYPIDALVPRVWSLRHNLSVYDAWYVALAEALDVALITSDAKLARSPGIRCEIELIV